MTTSRGAELTTEDPDQRENPTRALTIISAPARNSIPEQIGMLEAPHEHGIVTSVEFEARKADLLSQL